MKPRFFSPLAASSLKKCFHSNARQVAAVFASLATISMVNVEAATWNTGATTQEWNTAGNWDVAPGGTNLTVNTASGNFPIISTTPTFTPVDIVIGTGTAGRLDHRAGTAATGNGNWLIVGRNASGNGIYNLADTSTTGGTLTGFGVGTGSANVGGTSTTIGRLLLGDTGNSQGTANVNTSGTLKLEQDDTGLFLGNGGTSIGNFNFDGGTLQINSLATNIGILVGTNGGDGNFRMSGGTANVTGGLWLGDNSAASQGLLQISGGALNVTASSVVGTNTGGQVFIGRGLGQGTMNVSGTANVTITGSTNIGFSNTATTGTTGILTVSGGAFSNSGEMRVGAAQNANTIIAAGTGTFNVSGGTALVSGNLLFGRGNDSGDLVTGQGTYSGGTLTVVGDLIAAYAGNGNISQITVSGGTVNVGTAAERWLQVNQYDTARGQITVSSGNLNLNTNSDLRFSAGGGVGASSVTLSGGAITSYSGNGTGTATSGVVDLNQAGATANNTFNLNGGTLTIAQVYTNNNNGTAVFNFNGGTLKASNTSANFVDLGGATQTAKVLAGGALIDSNGYNLTIPEKLLTGTAGDGGLKKSGLGTLTLTAANTYNGATIVNGGTLSLTGAGDVNTSSGISINGSGAKLVHLGTTAISPTVTLTNGTVDGTGTINSLSIASSTGNTLKHGNGTAGTQLTVNSLSFNDAATVDINLTSNAAGILTTNLTTGAVDGAGKVTINAANSIWNPGDYNLITYTGSIGGVGFSEFVKGTVTGLSNRQSATLGDTGSAVVLTIAGDNPVWTGAASADWTTAAVFSPKNWLLPTANVVTDYQLNDIVLFDDTPGVNQTVNIAENVSPVSTTFNNNSLSYLFTSSGNFGITGGTVTLNGSGLVALATANTYAGGTTVNNGTLAINHASAIGTGPLSIGAFGKLDNTSGGAITLTTANVQNWNGNFTFVGTNDLNLGTGNVTLNANRQVSTLAGTLTVGGAISGTGFGLVKAEAGTLSLSGTNTYTGVTQVKAGTLAITAGSTGVIGTNLEISPTVTDTGTVSISGGTLNSLRTIIGGNTANNGSPGAGTLLQSGGTINTAQWFSVGSGAGTGATAATGVFTMTNGTLNASTVGTQNMEIANFAGTTGAVTTSGSSVMNLCNNASIALGANNNAGSGSFTQNGGTVTFFTNVATTVGGTGLLRLGNAGVLPATSTYSYDLNGGTLTVPGITRNAGAGNLSSGVFNFNGGTLKAAAASATFLQGITAANVMTGGALINDNGFAITILQPLLNGTPGDGGLTKSGIGTVTLTGNSTYVGATTVNAGTLSLAGTGDVNVSSGINVNGGKLLQLSSTAVSTPVTVTSGTVDGTGTLNSVTVTSGAGNIVANGNGTTAPLTITSLTFNDAATVNLKIDSATPVLYSSSIVTGAADSAGKITVNVTKPAWTNGQTYDLISYASLGGAGFAEFQKGTITGLTVRQSASLTNPTGLISLSIIGEDPVWTGALGSEWSTATLANPKNWKLPISNTATDFLATDLVLFDDSAISTSVAIDAAGVSPNVTTFANATKNYTFSSSGTVGIATGTVVKGGTGSVSLGNANTYAGGTTVNNGTLNLNNASAIGTGPLTITGGALGNTSGGAITLTTTNAQNWNGDFSYTGPDNLNMGPGAVTLGGSGSSRTVTVTAGKLTANAIPVATPGYGLTKAGAGTLAFGGTAASTIAGDLNVTAGTLQIGTQDFTATGLTGSGTVENGSAVNRWLYLNMAADTTFSGVLQNGAAAGNLGLSKSGVGTLTLTGANTYNDQTTVNQGKLVFSGTTNNTRTSNVVGTTAALNGTLVVSAGSTFGSNYTTGGQFTSSLIVGNNATTAGHVINNGGAINTAQQLALGTGTGGSSAFTQNSGSTTMGSFMVVGFTNDKATATINGGSLSLSNNLITIAAGVGAIGVFNATGGTVTSTATTGYAPTLGGIFVGENGTGVLNVSGTSALTVSGLSIRVGQNAGSNGFVNLNGGSITTNNVSKGAGNAAFSFNGGLLKASVANATFMQGLTSTLVRSGGARIESNVAITIAQPLLTPTGQGVSAAPSVSGGGFISAPIVQITGGGGVGATAVASIDGNGNLTGITITNPGIDYTTPPTFTLVGGGAGNTGAVTGTATLSSNVGGGLTKTGTGVLTLTGANNYTGNTVVNAGTLSISNNYLADAADVRLATGAVLNLTYAVGTPDIIDELYIDGVLQAKGTWGRIGSAAQHKSALITGDGILNVTNGTSDPYGTWATAKGLNDSDAAHSSAKGDDPDKDGVNNLAEFAFNGDPLSASNNGLHASLFQDTTAPAGNELTYIVAVRDGVTFSTSGLVQTNAAAVDGLFYTIQGSLDLNFPGSAVSHVSVGNTAPIATGLPDLTGTEWEYHTFRLDASEGLTGKGFLRAKVSE